VPTPPDDVVKITTSLIQLDVSVTDKKGRVITDLRPEELEVYENGKRQKLSGFSFVSAVREAEEAAPAGKQENRPVLPGKIKPEQVRRTIALVVDDLTLSFSSTYWVRKALKKFVDEQMREGDLVAIIRTGAGIGALQQFTSDKRQLYAAIERVRWNSAGAGKIGVFDPINAPPLAPSGDDQGAAADEETPDPSGDLDNFRQSVFATGTLGAISYVVRGMEQLPGRKSILLLSDGFSVIERSSNGMIGTGRVLDSLRFLVDQANRAAVVIYTLDARGLVVTGLSAEDNVRDRSFEEIDALISGRRDQIFDTQDGLVYLARETGGTALINNNDLSGGIRKILDDQSYYLVAYDPDDDVFDPRTRKFNKLEVKVTRPGVKVRYRSGFFGISDERMAPAVAAAQSLSTALASPFGASGITLHLNALFGSTGKSEAFLKTLLHIQAEDLGFTEQPDGTMQASFDLLALAYGDRGLPVDKVIKTFTITFQKEAYRKALEKGILYQTVFPIKKPGAYQLRVALRDHKTGNIGAANQFVEIPNLKKGRLTLSGIVLENVAAEGATGAGKNSASDTSKREFKQGTVLNYGLAIFNAKQPAGLASQIRIYRDGKPIYTGQPKPVTAAPAGEPAGSVGSFFIGRELTPGEYVLGVTVTETGGKKPRTATQFIDFEVVK
jgi:VWFA-related protein